MNSHKHARLTPAGRALLVQRVLNGGGSMAVATQAMGVSCRTSFKWLAVAHRPRVRSQLGRRGPAHGPPGLEPLERLATARASVPL